MTAPPRRSNGKERRRAAVMVNLEPSVYDVLARYCSELNCSMSSYVRASIFEKLRSDGAMNEQRIMHLYFSVDGHK
jgi:hypothetical protein